MFRWVVKESHFQGSSKLVAEGTPNENQPACPVARARGFLRVKARWWYPMLSLSKCQSSKVHSFLVKNHPKVSEGGFFKIPLIILFFWQTDRQVIFRELKSYDATQSMSLKYYRPRKSMNILSLSPNNFHEPWWLVAPNSQVSYLFHKFLQFTKGSISQGGFYQIFHLDVLQCQKTNTFQHIFFPKVPWKIHPTIQIPPRLKPARWIKPLLRSIVDPLASHNLWIDRLWSVGPNLTDEFSLMQVL